MTPGWSRAALAFALGLPLAAHAVDLTRLDEGMTGPRTEVLVLGTVHLSEQPPFKPEALDPLLDRLAAFKPGYITIEDIGGEQCDMAARHPTVYGEDYCGTKVVEKARAATGLDIPAAIAATDRLLAAWPAAPTPAQRRELASRFLAADDRASAYVQWLRLPERERHAGDGLDEVLVEVLRQTAQIRNEDYLVAARLAARLGLERVYQVDDHTGDNMRVSDLRTFGQQMDAAWKAGRARLDEMEKAQAGWAEAGDYLSIYRAINQPSSLQVYAEVNANAALRAVSAEHYPQMWVNGWEIRNLRMVANILQVVREKPGARVLSIVGVSHKPWFDAWLGQMQGVDVGDVEQVLR
ncbi:hypothetical protein ARC20_08835 [Stenotrophomonas panacihumi]|uniref:Polysaccharide biosynthesis protein GumN n=1 Tax=Stenotrophomonas panacihumi TaxID=676599 RepID=A0A0R0AG57_9GAMM|nr:DUF5694 domain-containing protein [Stenotrophomonas panacihumi]KRG44054.1 hypothetical protein ARC20_08835 [Stenotrophomonas panacihumi]PTN54291.1 hypothetical protein C9J98_10625 [Stenotrophomonas panacihumi]